MTDVGGLSSSTQDYLKALWSLGEWDASGVTITALAERLGVRTSTASDGVRKLADQGFVEHAPYGAIALTETGVTHALAMVRRHRLLEAYLESQLGYSWDEVHEEAESLEHAVSDTFIDRIDALLGHPTRDPHGDAIPPKSGGHVRPVAVPLATVSPGATVVISRISDASAERLRAFAEAGIVPDAVARVGANSELSVGHASYVMRNGDATALWVIPQQ